MQVISIVLHCQHSTLSISPNPPNGNITVAFNSLISGDVQLTIFDITGKKLFSKTVQASAGNNTYQLNLAMLVAGVYNLQLSNDGEAKKCKICDGEINNKGHKTLIC